MSSAIQSWLWPGIENEVRQVLQWRLEAPSASPTKGKIQFEDDGSNLRIPSAHTGHLVQILQFKTFEDPVEVTISDKATSIKARISSAASKRFSEKQGRRITERTRGGIIQIQEFEIVVTHLGPKSSRLTLLISNFNHLGCDGEGTFGCPRPIETQDGIPKFLDELQDFRSKQVRSSLAPPKEEEAMARLSSSSQGSDEGLDDDVKLGDTQSGFATQVPRAKSKKTKSEGQATHPDQDRAHQIPNVDCEEEILSQAGSEGCHSRERSASPAEAIRSKTSNTLLQATSKRSNGGKELDAKGGASLLSLLNVKRGGVQQTANFKALTSILALPTGFPNSNKTERSSNHSTEKLHPDFTPVATKGSGTPDKGSQKSPSPEGGSASVCSSTTALDSRRNNAGRSSSSHPPSLQGSPLVNGYPSQKQLQEHHADQPQLFATKSLTPTTEKDANPASRPITHRVDELWTKPKDPDPDSINTHSMKQLIKDPWEGMSRISRRSVTIPKDQQTLLDRKDCWLPAEPGTRAPVANIPLKTLQAYTMQIDNEARPKRSKPSKPKRLPINNAKITSPRKQLSLEPDVLISSGDWPSSPPIPHITRQLPPDSDQDEPVQCDQESLPTLSNPLDHAIMSRASLIDQKSTPPRKGSQLSRASSSARHRGSSQMTDSLTRSRTRDPSSSVEQKSFMCPDSTCSKRYSGSSGLKYHVDKFHPEFKPLKRTKRDRLNSESDFEKVHESDSRRKRSRLPNEEKPYEDHQMCSIGERGAPTNNQACKNGNQRHVSPEQRKRQSSKVQTPEVGDELAMIYTQIEQHLCNENVSNNVASIEPVSIALSNPEQALSQPILPNGASEEREQSESDSELETTVPHPLDSGTMKDHLKAVSHGFPVSTNPNQESVLQVNRTPYSHEPKKKRLPVLRNHEQPPSKRFDSFLEELPPDNMISSTFDSRQKYNRKVIKDPMKDSDDASRLPGLVREDNEVFDSATSNHQRCSSTTIAMPLSPESSDLNHIIDAKSKRKASENSHGLPNVTKRRKRLKISTKFGLSQDAPVSGEDPKVRAQKQRREFFAALKNDNLQSRDPTNVDFRHEGYESDATMSNDDLRNGMLDSTTGSIKIGKLDSEIDTDATAFDTESSKRSDVNRRRASCRREDNDIDTRSLISELLEAAATPDVPQSIKVLTVTSPCPAQLSYLDLFKQAYPAYTGSKTHFLAMCGKLRSLELQNRVEHRSLWDDFIIRHQIEYRQYLIRCTEQAEDPIPYERFYREKVDMPLYTNAIVTPSNLGDIIKPREPIQQENVQEHRSLQYQSSMANGSNPQSVTESRQQSLSSTSSSYQVENPQLTGQSPSPRPTETMQKQQHQAKAASPSQITKSPNQRVTINSQSPSQPVRNINHQTTATNIVDLISSPSPHPSPIAAAPPQRPPRSLPWKKLAPSPSTLPPSTSNQPHSSPNPSKPSPLCAFAKPSVPLSTTPKPAYSKPTIRTSLPKTSSVPASLSTSTCFNHAKPAAPASSSAPKKGAGSIDAKEWYHDPSTPFKDFMRADLAIRAGNGNAWAMEKEKGREGEKGNGKEKERQRRETEVKLDVLGWSL